MRQPAAQSWTASPLTHVYRFASSGNQRLGKDLPFNPIATVIDRFVKSRKAYGYSELLLIGVLLATRPNDVPEMAFLLRELLEEAYSQLSADIQLGRWIILASELVYRCFLETQLAEYQVDVPAVDAAVLPDALDGIAPLIPSASTAHQSAGLRAQSLAFVRSDLRVKHASDTKPSSRNAGAERAVPYFVTPGDLAASPNLVLAGVLHT